MAIEKAKLKAAIACMFICVVVISLSIYFASKAKNQTTNNLNLNEQKLLVILLDGVRYDYVSKLSYSKGFEWIERNGVKVENLHPIFPANSYPNWYTILTGLYPENNGFIDNYMYDSVYKDFYLMETSPNASNPHWWNDAEPLWTQAEKHGHKTSVYNWFGCQVEISSILPTHCTAYKRLDSWPNVNEDTNALIEQILKNFQTNQFKLSLLYYEPIDHIGHKTGPDSPHIIDALMKVDEIIHNLIDKIEKMNLKDTVNVYILSDHGMASVTNVVKLQVNLDDVRYSVGKGAILMILPINKQSEDNIYRALKEQSSGQFYVYRKNEIPEKFHIKNNRKILPIMVRAKPGFYLFMPNNINKVYPHGERTSSVGTHGYFYEEFDQMNGITYAFGPAFESGKSIESLSQVDHYQVFCHILDMPMKPHNGSWQKVSPLLRQRDRIPVQQ